MGNLYAEHHIIYRYTKTGHSFVEVAVGSQGFVLSDVDDTFN